MTKSNLAAFPQESNDDLKITAKNLRIATKRESKTKAFCAIEITLPGTLGNLEIDGFSVVQGEKGFWVGWPQRRGERAWFDIVKANGKIRELVCAAVLAAYGDAQTGA